MDDIELTRMAIAEIVRELGELKQPAAQERKLNPIAKPNKRFLGRTLHSMMSHNKREDDRTQANCRRKLKELEERRSRRSKINSRSRSSSSEFILSSSSDESRVRNLKKYNKEEHSSKKHKKHKRSKNKNKKHKAHRYFTNRCRSQSSQGSYKSGHSRIQSRKVSKTQRSKTVHSLAQSHNYEEGGGHKTDDYEADINTLQFDADLLANTYRQHQIQQLLYYSALMADASIHVDAVREELQINDAVLNDAGDKKSISSAISSLITDEDHSDDSEVLQISISSGMSDSSNMLNYKRERRKGVEKNSHTKSVLTDSCSSVIWDLDSDNSHVSNCTKDIQGIDNLRQDDCICIASETESVLMSSDSEIEKYEQNVFNSAAGTVTLLTSSDSEVEIVTSDTVKSQLSLSITSVTYPPAVAEVAASLITTSPPTDQTSVQLYSIEKVIKCTELEHVEENSPKLLTTLEQGQEVVLASKSNDLELSLACATPVKGSESLEYSEKVPPPLMPAQLFLPSTSLPPSENTFVDLTEE